MGSNSLGHAAAITRETLPPMHPAGRPFVLGGIAATLALRKVSAPLGVLAGLGTLATAAFFREPVRVPPERSDLVVAAADGTVSLIEEAAPPAELGLSDEPRTRVSVFLSVFDVHVQRMPVTGVVERAAYRPGKFLSADLDKASEDNERNSLLVRTDAGHDVVVTQIAGLGARTRATAWSRPRSRRWSPAGSRAGAARVRPIRSGGRTGSPGSARGWTRTCRTAAAGWCARVSAPSAARPSSPKRHRSLRG